jgi:hypothetical protein
MMPEYGISRKLTCFCYYVQNERDAAGRQICLHPEFSDPFSICRWNDNGARERCQYYRFKSVSTDIRLPQDLFKIE